MDPLSEINAELEKAQNARARGKEGQARVCARRAAGIAAHEYFARRAIHPRTTSAYDLLKLIAEEPSIAQELRMAATYLTLRVDEEFKMPPGIDLIAEARFLCNGLNVSPDAL